MKKILILLISFTLFPLTAYSISVNPQKWDKSLANENAVFLTRGPKDHVNVTPPKDFSYEKGEDICLAKAYRVSFLVYEIYYSIGIDELRFSGGECSRIEILNTYFYSGFDVGKTIGTGRLTGLSFGKWISPNEFELKEYEKTIRFKILNNGKLEIIKQ